MPAAQRDTRRAIRRSPGGGERVQRVAATLHAAARHGVQPLMQPIDPAAEVVLRRDHHFGGCRRRRRAQVGDEIGDRDVGLVPDGGDDRHGARGNRSRHAFLVERPEIFDRSAAAAGDDDVDAGHARDRAQPLDDLGRRIVSLDARRADDQVGVRMPAAAGPSRCHAAPRRRVR